MKTRQLIHFACFAMASASSTFADTITWDGNGTNDASGGWSVSSNWDADAVPGASDTAVLTDVTSGTRTIMLDSAATSPVQQVDFDQSTAGAANVLEIQKNALTVTNAIALGAASGTERLSFNTANNGSVLTASGGITINAGGELSLSGYRVSSAATVNLGNVTGNVTISGGSLQVRATENNAAGNTATSAQNTITGGLTMSSGSLIIDNGTGLGDRRLSVSGPASITGGAISSTLAGSNGMISFQNGSGITFTPTSFDADLNLALDGGIAQSISTDKTLGNLLLRGTGAKTVTSSASGTGIGQLQLFDGNNAISNSRTSLKLGSNLTLTSGRNQPAAQSFGNSHESGRVDLGIDTNGFTFDLSAGASSGVWTPNASTQSGVNNTVWDLSGTGTIKANGINLSAAGITSNIGAGTTLLVVGGNGVLFHLGTLGIIDPSAVLRYSGTADIATPALMTSFRDVGDIEVTSGALRLRSISTGNLQDLRVSGGTMDLDGSTTRTFATISLTGGTLANGTFATSETDYTGLETGTVSGRLTGARQLIKNSPGTLTLSGAANNYSGETTVQQGTLALGNAAALGNTPTLQITGGTLDLGGNTINKYISTLSNGGVIQNGTFLRNFSNTSWTFADGTISANLTDGGGFALSIIKNSAGTVILSGANHYAGNTTVSAGTLTLSNAPDPLNANPGNDASTVTIAATGATLNLTYTGTDKVDKLFIGATQMAPGMYGKSGSVPPVIGLAQITGDGTLTVASGPAGFSGWITGTFTNGTVPGGQQGPNDDPDGDGIANLVEYAVAGLDPTVSNSQIGTFDGVTLAFSKRQPLAGDITYGIEESTDLGIIDTWADVVPTTNNGTIISYDFPGGPAKDFLRLKITRP